MNPPFGHRPARIVAVPPRPGSTSGTLAAVLRTIDGIEVELVEGRSERSTIRRIRKTDPRHIVVGGPSVVGAAPAEAWLTAEVDEPPTASSIAAAAVVACSDERSRDGIEAAFPEAIGKTAIVDAASITTVLTRRRPDGPALGTIGVVGYDHGFIKPVLDILGALEGTRLIAYEWPKFAVDEPDRTAAVLAEADVVIAEWCGPNAIAAARAKRPDQRLVVHLHRFELERGTWRDLDIDAVDQVIVPGPHYRRLVLEATGWPPASVLHIPNVVDGVSLLRPKSAHAQYTLGMLGASSPRKRLDLALEVVARLRATDPRYRLTVKSADPRSQKWVWDRPEARAFFEAAETRMAEADLADAVTWEPAGPDVARWFRQVGVTLSVSDDESFHLAPAEGMASGAVPAVRAWPGAAGIYADRWIHDDVDQMVRAISAATVDEASWNAESERARLEAGRWAPERVAARWAELLAAR